MIKGGEMKEVWEKISVFECSYDFRKIDHWNGICAVRMEKVDSVRIVSVLT